PCATIDDTPGAARYPTRTNKLQFHTGGSIPIGVEMQESDARRQQISLLQGFADIADNEFKMIGAVDVFPDQIFFDFFNTNLVPVLAARLLDLPALDRAPAVRLHIHDLRFGHAGEGIE